jgi:hypothetical protein
LDKISNITNDGTIDQFNTNFTAKDYATTLDDYIRFNLIKNSLKNLKELYNNQFYINQMLLSCSYHNQICSIDDFMPHFDYYYGLCWRFNMGKSVKGKDIPVQTSGQVGWKHGLQLELYKGNEKIQERFSMSRGFRLFIFNRSNQYPVGLDIGVDVATGRATSIGIKRSFLTQLPAPYSNCLPTDINQIDWSQNEVLQFMYDNFIRGQYYSSEGFWTYAGNWTWNWTVSYSQSICVKLCFQKYLFQTCGMKLTQLSINSVL